MFQARKLFEQRVLGRYIYPISFTVTMPLRKVSDLEKTVAAASAVFRDVCSEKPPYHTAEELWEGLKQGHEGARLLFLFFLRQRKNERKRQEMGCRFDRRGLAPLFTDAPPGNSVPGKTKVCYCNGGE